MMLDGGDAWRSRNDFALTWKPDRAPVTAAAYELCSVGTGDCSHGERTGTDIARIGVQVPDQGQWTFSIARRDAAGNERARSLSPGNTRFDSEPPEVAFEPVSETDRTLVRASVTDKVSGLAGARSKSAQPGPASGGRFQQRP